MANNRKGAGQSGSKPQRGNAAPKVDGDLSSEAGNGLGRRSTKAFGAKPSGPAAKKPGGRAPAKRGRGPAGPHKTPPTEIISRGEERLQKVIADAGLASRRGAEKLIAEGRVTVNGRKVEEAGLKVDAARDRVTVDGRLIPPPERPRYYMFNKPAGYLTTMSDPKGRPTIKSYVDNLPARVFPVGRLDMDVEGLLLLTNDGDLAKRLMHPSTKAPKTYWVKVEGHPDERDMEKLRSGVLMIGDRPAAPAEAELIKTAVDKDSRPRAWILLTLTEGRHHQVKRMCSSIGHPVLKLKRISYAGLDLGRLRREEIRPLTNEEIKRLKKY